VDKRLEELLREQSDIENLLEAFGEEASGEEKADRQRVLELAADFGDAQLLSALFDHAKGFALMSQEIFDFCAESGTGIAGQIQVQADAIQFAEHSLDAGWAFGGGTRWTSGAEQRASSLASELESIASSLSKKKLLRTTHETYVEPWARHLDDREPQSQLLRDIATESRTHRFFTEGDYSEINAFRVELSDAQGRLAHAPIGAAVASAFSELETKCHSLLREMRPVRPGESHAQIRAARDNFASTTSQVLRLVDEVTEGRRVEAGLADFLRTDFWHQRWRVYEIWVLVWTLRSLQACGAKTQLSNVEQGVWMLKYGRALEPVAICEIGGKLLEVYYQLYRKRAQANQKSASKKSADMPDIAVLRKGGRPLCVIDPKHGRSYGRSAVQKVLNTYSTIFKADFTAIVNCLAMEDYQYEETYVGTRLGVVASGVAPGASAAARLREVRRRARMTRTRAFRDSGAY